MSEIKPCPFCGGEAHITNKPYHNNAFLIYGQCLSCFATGSEVILRAQRNNASYQETRIVKRIENERATHAAAMKWNERT